MKFRSVNEFTSIDFNDSTMKNLSITDQQMVVTAEGVIIKANNSVNQRFEDMYTVLLEMTFDHFRILHFDEQGYRHYDADGQLLEQIPDRPLSEDEQKTVLHLAKDSYIFLVEKCPDQEGYEIIFDITNEEEDTTTTDQLFFDFDGCVAQWDRFSGPVNGQL